MPEKYFTKLTFKEILNHFSSYSSNEFSSELYDVIQKNKLGGHDLHCLLEIYEGKDFNRFDLLAKELGIAGFHEKQCLLKLTKLSIQDQCNYILLL